MHISKCEFGDCDKKDNCERFIHAQGTLINFKDICYKRGYQWHMPIKEEVEECLEELQEESQKELVEETVDAKVESQEI